MSEPLDRNGNPWKFGICKFGDYHEWGNICIDCDVDHRLNVIEARLSSLESVQSTHPAQDEPHGRNTPTRDDD